MTYCYFKFDCFSFLVGFVSFNSEVGAHRLLHLIKASSGMKQFINGIKDRLRNLVKFL